ncbi:hypothetical protein IIF27_004803 [Salmonella enterica]|nr:hypothetical protein [Salmonella enterica]
MNDPNLPTKEQIEATAKVPDNENPNTGASPPEDPHINPVQCYLASENSYYKVGDEICYFHTKWRCGSSGQWYSLGTHCN